MNYHVFNIGQPANSEWWAQNLRRGVITAGFEGGAGDRGDVILNDMDEGDWVIAYANGYGFVGAGRVGYGFRLHDELPAGSMSDHLHERQIAWADAVTDVRRAVTTAEAGRQAPRQTKEREGNVEVAQRIRALLQQRGDFQGNLIGLSGPEQYWRVADATKALFKQNGRPATAGEIRAHIVRAKPDYIESNALPDLSLLTVNGPNRGHHQRKRSGSDLRSDQGHRHDVLFKSITPEGPAFEPYDKAKHGVWELVPDYRGKPRLVEAGSDISLLDAAMEEARELVQERAAPPIDSDHDARTWALVSVAEREGQPEFRVGLLAAYGHQCAMTGCRFAAVLEAAHIVPHRGLHTMRVDNGLLLRSDLHTLFDRGLIWVDPYTFEVQIAPTLQGSEYGPLHRRKLTLPAQAVHHPRREHLATHMRLAKGSD
jgi:predicted restriction endonuclease